MPNVLPDPVNPGANLHDHGHEMNYALWTNDTILTLCNVPWDANYRDIVSFGAENATPAQRRKAMNDYIDGLETPHSRITNSRYAKVNEPVKIAMSFNQAIRYNYLRASNPITPVNGDVQKDYYYFITDVVYSAPKTTILRVQLDVWATFGPDIKITRAYVERGHLGIANDQAFGVGNDYGLNYLAIPEGLDTGSDLVTANYSNRTFGDPTNFNVLIASAANMQADPWITEGEGPRSPNIVGSTGSVFQNVPSGLEFYVFKNGYEFVEWLEDMIEEPHVTQGILSISLIPPIERYYSPWPGYLYDSSTGEPVTAPSNPGGGYKPRPTPVPMTPQTTEPPASVMANWRDATLALIPAKYRHLKKLLTFPYCAIEVNTFNGVPVLLRPELLASANLELEERVALMPPGQRISLAPKNYLAGFELDYAAYIQNFPTLGIANDGGVLALNARQPSIQYQRNAADWSQEKVRQANQNAVIQTGISNDLRTRQTDISNEAAWQQTGLGAIGGFAGAGSGRGAAGAALSAGQNAVSTAISTGAAGRSTGASNAAAVASNSENIALATRVAQGDYAQSIAGIEASIQETNAIPPSTVGAMGGELFNYINGYFRARVMVRILPASAMKKIGDFWLRYGYAVERFVNNLPASMRVMERFTYWKLSETYITGGYMPETYKQTLRGIFEKGVTVWTNPDDIGTGIDNNAPLPGINY